MRSNIQAINNCIYYLGRYIEAFQLNNYNLTRISKDEYADSIEVLKEEISLDNFKKDYEELQNLGILAANLPQPQVILPSDNNTNLKDNKAKNVNTASTALTPLSVTFMGELKAIEEKVRIECSKVYTGEYLKLIQNNEKMPAYLNDYLNKSKDELAQFRLTSIRILRTHSQNLFSLSIKLGKVLFEFITFQSFDLQNTFFKSVESEYILTYKLSEKTKNFIDSKLSSHLANPHYNDELQALTNKEKNRNTENTTSICNTQIKLLVELESLADKFYKRLNNNFEAFATLLENFIFEEEYLDLGDTDDFKERKTYNYLLKLKEFNKEVNLSSKRSIKKINIGLDKQILRVNYYKRFTELAKEVVEGVEEKLKSLEVEYLKNIMGKNINTYDLINTKSLKTSRDVMFDKYSKRFYSSINYVLDFYTMKKLDEDNYAKNWLDSISKLNEDN